VRGRHFYQHHKLFEELSTVVDSHIDELAERITTLGGYARGGVRDAARASRLEDFPADQRDDQGYVDVMSARFAACANEVRLAAIAAEELDDATTADLLTGISRALDKSVWMLEAHMRPMRGDVETATDARAEASERMTHPIRPLNGRVRRVPNRLNPCGKNSRKGRIPRRLPLPQDACSPTRLKRPRCLVAG
jgi:starvation-inducible DNA-binding protein